MLAAENAIPQPIMTVSPPDYRDRPLHAGIAGQRQFKKHKVLPRPHNERGHESMHVPRAGPKNYDLRIDTSRPIARDESSGRRAAQPSSPRTLKHQPRRIGSGPDLPPTPPRHSRKSSGNSAVLPSSPTIADPAFQTPRNAPPQPPSTPPNQRSPPTPDVTPPQPVSRPALLRPTLTDRTGSKATTTGSQSGSFKTAREEPFSSEDEDKTSGATKTSLSTVRQISNNKSTRAPKLNGLGLALAGLDPPEDSNASPIGGDFNTFDGDWSSVSEVEQEWDGNLLRMVTIKKRPEIQDAVRPISQAAIIVAEPETIMPTQATKAVRQMPLHGRPDTISSTKGVSERGATSTATSSTGTSISSDARRASAISTKSTVSTVVEAMLVDGPPQRQRTLRHVRKQVALRGPDDSSPSSTTNSLKLEKVAREPRARTRPQDGKHESYASSSTVRSVSSGKARREVWKNGGIPVIVVPDRRSSNKSRSREPSLRSHSSRRSNQTRSVSSISTPLDEPAPKEVNEVGPTFPRQSRRSRAFSESDGSERTMDFPPTVPARSSSLSAPTSRNTSRAGSQAGSRAGSLTSESMKIHNALQESLLKRPEEKSLVPVVCLPGDAATRPIPSTESDKDASQRRLSSGPPSEFLQVKSYASLKTPFSLASVETNGTAPVLSEAFAVQMYPHQNSSVLMVDHSAKPSETSIETHNEPETREIQNKPKLTLTDAAGGIPVTPPQPQFSLDDVDSPLRNPRPPPEIPIHPPAIKLIPATPSGMTPANEKMIQMGNYFETTGEKPLRRPSIVRRALSRRRRHSVDYPSTIPRAPGLLTRTFSLSHRIRTSRGSSSRDNRHSDMEREPAYPSPEDSPAEEGKLHPFWRPQYSSEDTDGCDGNCEGCRHEMDEPDEEVVYRYPAINNRPQPQRKLSSRMKRTFAILPPRDEEYYYANDSQGPERRTIRRTPSGNLRVMRHRASLDSLRRNYKHDEELHPVSDDEDRRPFWRRNSMHRRASKESHRLSLGSRLEEIQNIPRKISEKRREKRTRELRQKISGPREVRDGVGEVIRSSTFRDQHRSNGL
ncbi:hypothetical protein AK830_g11396 [Neonectria ditissima]|uniref:Uncharacterized protein n=1 Tax=Neonectria ditissima TaxID=78410 RepID=A0A0P7AMK5_9HYPO|nr:hypothetical protein AK830_g11396 [Neonectria ditissima]